ncbi:MAG: sigma-70 family RNA polymerase sigma factor [Bacteroidetes bacterium]|nr:sigma-70 family RNA polymerase sigma factor [Bacteroidota bacterium]
MPHEADITQLLLNWSGGDREALDRLMPLVYTQLRQMAHARLREQSPDHTLNTTALVHEAYIKLIDTNQVQWHDRAHFLAAASRLMRHILVDYWRRQKAYKRGGEQQRVDLDEALMLPEAQAEAVLEMDEALKRLEALNPRQSQVVEHRYFGGLTAEESARVLDVSRATVERDLKAARAWLARELDRLRNS